jgi:hypothetical protein
MLFLTLKIGTVRVDYILHVIAILTITIQLNSCNFQFDSLGSWDWESSTGTTGTSTGFLI